MDKDILFIIYSLLENKYIKKFQENENINNLSNNNLFPDGWFSWDDYSKKIELLTNALDKNEIITDIIETKKI